MDIPLGSVTALIFCCSGCDSLVACSVDLIVVFLGVYPALLWCRAAAVVWCEKCFAWSFVNSDAYSPSSFQ